MENLLSEAFQRLSLLEQDFDFSTVDKDKVDELSAFIADDVEEIPEEPIIDVNAETEDDLADNYVGKVILECECCHTRIYKNEEDVVIDDEAGLANIDEACPVCNNSLGYSVIGKIEAFDSERVIEPEEDEEDIPEEETPEVEESEEEKEEENESLEGSKIASEDSKKLDEVKENLKEAKLPLHDRLARKHLDSLVGESEVNEFDCEAIARGEDPAELAMEGEAGEVDEKLSAKEAERMAEITKNGVVKASDRNEYKELRDKEKVDEELLDHGNDNLEANKELATKDTQSLEDDQTELVHAAGDKIEAINESADDVCPECGKAPCVCEGCKDDLDEACDGSYDNTFDRDFDAAIDALEKEKEKEKAEMGEAFPDDLPDVWGKNRVNEAVGDIAQEVVDVINDSVYPGNISDTIWASEVTDGYGISQDLSATEIADIALDAGFTVYKPINGQTGYFGSEDDYLIFANPHETLEHFIEATNKEFDMGLDEKDFVLYNNKVEESLTESVEVHTDGESVDLVKNDDGSLSIEVGGEGIEEMPLEEPLEAPEEPVGAEEIVPLEPEDQSAIEANVGEEEDEFAEPLEEPIEDEFAEEPAEEEEEEEPFESLEASGKPAINESAKESNTIEDKIAKETLKQAKINTKMMQLDLAAKQAEAEANAAPIEDEVVEEPIEDEIESEEEVEESLDTTNILETIENVDETKINSICEAFLKRVYGNVKSFTTTNISMSVNEAFIEGTIGFTSGKTKSTTFNFANPEITKRGKLVLEGFNKTFSDSPKAFKLKSVVNGNNMVAESMIYSFTSKQLNESNEQETVRVYGRVKA